MSEETAPPPNLVDLMDRLIEPREPAPVSLMPETAGWAVLGVAMLAALLWGVRRLALRRRANAYRRAALAALDRAGDDPAAIAAILRRTALAAWPRERVAGLAGAEWLRFLDATGGAGAFSEPPGDALARAPYAEHAPVPGLKAVAARWVRRHRPEAAP